MITLREYSEKISNMWVYEANGNDTPDTVSYGSAKEFTWRCNNNPKHIFKKKVLQMFNNKTGEPIGCIYCEAERPLPFPGETDLFSILPIAKDMWDYDKNIGFDTSCIHPGTPTKAWFKCENSHSFQRDICRFVKNQDCPTCKELKNVIAKFPHMVKQWHFEKNAGIDINLTSANSSQTVWWKCRKCNYEWQAEIASRRASKGLCPCCEVRIVVQEGATDLFTLFPSLKEEYDFEKNKDIDGKVLSITTSTPVWWKCKYGHEWKVSPSARIQSSKGKKHVAKCPHCQGIKRLISYAEEYPELKDAFIDEKNGCPFDTITAKERLKRFWWLCNKCQSEFESSTQAMVRSYTTFAKGCPYCAGKKVKRENSFATLHPDVMDEYASENKMDPFTVAEKSDKTVNWICRNNPKHKWSASFKQRANGTGNCPECRGWHYNKMLWQERPDLEKYFDTRKNKRLFKSYSFKSNDKVWWICEKGHSFERAICNAVIANSFECSICTNKQLAVGINDLASQFPELAAEFDCERNKITPDQVIQNSMTEYWWHCKEGHDFFRSSYYRTTSFSRCPICTRTIVVKGINDFQTVYPKILEIWDYDKNDVKPDEISDRNTGKFTFKCSKGHTYDSYLSTAIYNNFNCLICNNVLIQPGVNSLIDTHPELAMEFSPNEVRNPDEFTKDMAYSILWRCPVCQGDYNCSIRDREFNDDSCPYCNNRHRLAGVNTLETTNERLATEWSPNNSRPVTDFFETDTFYAYWICPVCSGEYGSRICDRKIGDNKCPYCNDRKALLGLNSLVDTHYDLTKEWSKNNDRLPSEFMKSNASFALWICPKCLGEYSARICDRTIDDDMCPYCRGIKVLPGYNSFKNNHKDLMDEWNYKNNYLLADPDYIFDNSKKSVWWICKTCDYNYQMSLRKKTYYKLRHMKSCPKCKGLRQKKQYYI